MVDAQASLQHAAQGPATAAAAPAPEGSTSTSGMLEERRDTLAMAGGRRAVVIIQDYAGGPAPPAPPPFRPGRGKYPSDYPGDDAGQDGQDLDPADAADPVDLEPMEPGQPALPSVATLCNSAIGAGMLSLPFAFSKAGVLGGLLLCSTIGAAEGFTLYVLSKMAERYRATSYSQLVRKTLGKKMATFLSLLMAAYMWGACNAYLVIVGDVFSALGRNTFGPDSLLANRRVIIAAIGLGLLLPLCFIKRLGALAALSSIAVAGFLYTSGIVILTALKETAARPDPWKDVQLIKFDSGAFFALPVIVFGFNCHANAVTIFHELTHEPSKQILPIKSRRKTSKLVNMIGVIITAILLIMVGYLAVGLAGYLAYPTSVTSNIINNLPGDDPWVEVARAFIGIVVAGHYPLNHHPARSGAVDLAVLSGYSQGFAEEVIAPVFTLVFVSTSVLVSLFVQDLGDVLHLIGGTAAALLIFFNPGCMLINAAIVKDSSARLARVSTLQRAREDASMRGEELDHHDAKAARDEARVPLLEAAVVKGIKKTGMVYSPGKSWAAGLLLVAFSVVIMVTTMVTTFMH